MLLSYSAEERPLKTLACMDVRVVLYESGLSISFFYLASAISFYIGTVWGVNFNVWYYCNAFVSNHGRYNLGGNA